MHVCFGLQLLGTVPILVLLVLVNLIAVTIRIQTKASLYEEPRVPKKGCKCKRDHIHIIGCSPMLFVKTNKKEGGIFFLPNARMNSLF